MRKHAVVMSLVCAGACSKQPSTSEAQQSEQRVADEAKPELPEPAKNVEPTPTPGPSEAVETPSEPGEPGRELSAAAKRWAAGAHATPSRSSPPPTSVLGRLPKAEAVALVVSDRKLELVAAVPSGWRLELAAGALEHVSFEPASGLVIFFREQSVWAMDLLEPLAAEATAPAIVELARLPADPSATTPSEVILCFPPTSVRTIEWCRPEKPLPSDMDPAPEYLAINWDDEPSSTWHVPLEDIDYESPDTEQYKNVSLTMVGHEWLRARADRRQHFDSIISSVHGFFTATPMPGAPALAERCLDAEDCGKSLPLGVSGWEWVIVASDQGDLFHPSFAVYDPATQRWANLEQLLASTATWVPTAKLEPALDQLGAEVYPLFDGAGRVFADPSHEQLCWFRMGEQVATAVTCEAAGGHVAGFLSVSTQLGKI